jgi:hypothetical protein
MILRGPRFGLVHSDYFYQLKGEDHSSLVLDENSDCGEETLQPEKERSTEVALVEFSEKSLGSILKLKLVLALMLSALDSALESALVSALALISILVLTFSLALVLLVLMLLWILKVLLLEVA